MCRNACDPERTGSQQEAPKPQGRTVVGGVSPRREHALTPERQTWCTTHPHLGLHSNSRYTDALSGSPTQFYLLGVPDTFFAPGWTVSMPNSMSYFHLTTCFLEAHLLEKKPQSLGGKNYHCGSSSLHGTRAAKPRTPSVSDAPAIFSLTMWGVCTWRCHTCVMACSSLNPQVHTTEKENWDPIYRQES